MAFDRQFLDTLRTRLSASQVVSQFVKLKPKGRGEFMGLCPFHQEKSPSFTVSDPKGFYHCFGCGVHGDIVSFVMQQRGLTYPEAIKDLADQAGIEVPKQDFERYKKEQEKTKTLYDVMELACNFYQSLLNTGAGRIAREYLSKRGVIAENIKKFRLGYSPDNWEDLKNHLIKEGISIEDIDSCGLVSKNEEGTKIYDRFRNRLMFPIFDANGRVIAFGGRILTDEKQSAKYLNSPETDLFHKGYNLYAYNFARDAAYKAQNVLIVEGYMDVIALHQAGITNAVAPLGTAVTEHQITQLWKMAKSPTFCLDGDAAGIRAMKRLAENFISELVPGYSMQFAFMPNGKDPDEIIKQNGVEYFHELVSSATPLSDAIWKINLDEFPMKTPEDKAEFAQKMHNIADSIKNQVVKDFYKKEYSSKIYELGRRAKYSPKNAILDRTNQLTKETAESLYNSQEQLVEKKIIFLLCYNPCLLNSAEVEDFVLTTNFSDKNLANLLSSVIDFIQAQGHNGADYSGFLNMLKNDNLQNQIEILETSALKREYIRDDKDCAPAAWQYLLSEYNFIHIENEIKNLIDNKDENIEKIFELQKQKAVLKGKMDSARVNYDDILNG